MIEDMNDKDILDKARMEGMNQGIWLAVQELAYDGRWTQAAEELVSSCGLTEDECRKLQEESGSFDDEMLEFIDTIFSRKIDLDENNQRISVNISTMKVGDTYSFADNHGDMVKIRAIERSNLGCRGCYLSNDGISCSGCNKEERETNDDIAVIRTDKIDEMFYDEEDEYVDTDIGVVCTFALGKKRIRAIACKMISEHTRCSDCCFEGGNRMNISCYCDDRKDNTDVFYKEVIL